VVGKGESLSAIAAQHGLRLGELVAANGIASPYRIRPGQSLIIPPTEAGRSQHVAAKPSEDLVAIAPPPPLSADGFLWPVQGDVIGSFEENSGRGRSGGINIAARKGTPVRAADNGIVAYAGEALRGYGQMIMLRHAEGYVTLYAHNDALLVREGDVVERGQTIAEVGNSGDVIESQLHFELRKGTQPVDPTKILAGLPGRVIGKL
jgi:murein DD-endopeptidase MepM/ murein hydrolase activator NlpD